MQKTARSIRGETGVAYRERLSPSLWLLVSAAVCAPMAALMFAPIDTTLALVAGAIVGIGVVAGLVGAAPVVEVRDGRLRAGHASIEVDLLGEARPLTAEDARQARGAGLNPRSWHVIRGGIDGVVVVDIVDPEDPTPSWVISTRTPDRLVAAIRRAQTTLRTPSR